MGSFDRLRQAWTPEDDHQLRELAGAGVFVPEIAKALSRTVTAVRARAGVLGIRVRLSSHPTRSETAARRKNQKD